MTVEIACKEAVFHFNKHHLIDPATPTWVIKTGGKTYQVEHVTADLPWSTKETVGSEHTKGSIKFHKALLTIDDNNHAKLTPLKDSDLTRIRAMKRNYTRIIIHGQFNEIAQWLKTNAVKHSPIKNITGGCGSRFQICDIKKQEDLVMMALIFTNSYRVLQANELYFRAYEDPELLAKLEADDYYDGENDEDDDQDE